MELRVWQDRTGRFSTELSERYQRSERALTACGRQKRAERGNIGPTDGNISVGPYSSTATAGDVNGLTIWVV